MIIVIQTPKVHKIGVAYTGSTEILFNIIHINARIITSAYIISKFFRKLIKASNVATIITIIVRVISLTHHIFHHILIKYVLIFAMVATEIRHKYTENGT